MRIWPLTLLALCSGCPDYVPGAAEDLSVVPSSGSTASETVIQVRGQLVLTRLRVDYAQPETVDPIARVKVWIRAAETDEVGEELLPVRLSEDKHLETIVPAGLAPGLYDVVVEDAYERERIIENAFTVIGTECSDGIQRGEPCGNDCIAIAGCECKAEDQCGPICGDGVIKGDERCDDGGKDAGDGCDSECRVEPGFSCEGAPSVCTTGCGDGVTAGSESCDDANDTPGDGCSPACQIEDGWSCAAGRCQPTCGDMLLVGEEVCEPELQRAGCGPNCRPLPGFECAAVANEPDRVVCRPTCGDGLKKGDEQCDDDNVRPDDGCFMCRVEEGWHCEGEPSTCSPLCGDGLVVGFEECDAGMDPNNAGALLRACGPNCKAAPGYICQGGICAPIECTVGEVCDDGSACTHEDVCRTESFCRGVPKFSCLSGCRVGCALDTTLPGTNCCEDACEPDGLCPDCQAALLSPEPMCNYVCTGSECRTRCRARSTCTFSYKPSPNVVGGSGRVDCDSDALCAMTCDGNAGSGEPVSCVMNCAEGSVCLLSGCDEQTTSCQMNCADQSQMECQTAQGRVLVCGRSCPN